MVKVRNIEGVLITAESYGELLKAVKNEANNYEGFQPKITIVDGNRAILYHDEIVDELAPPWAERFCAECGNYDWGRGCPFRSGHITLKMNACEHFTIEIREATK